jgi:transcriptional regulator with XRE-family HTH domain
MGRKTMPSAAARRRASAQAGGLADELRAARGALGLSRAAVAKAAGVARSTVERAESGDAHLTVVALTGIMAAVGLDLSIRVFPGEHSRIRDSRHATYVAALEALAVPHRRARIEVAAGEHGRSADLVLYGADEVIHVEVERRITDLQAQLRNAFRKREALVGRTDRAVRLVIAVPDTRSNRDVLRPHIGLLAAQLPGSTRDVLRALRTGENLGRDAMAWLRPRSLSVGALSGYSTPQARAGR